MVCEVPGYYPPGFKQRNTSLRLINPTRPNGTNVTEEETRSITPQPTAPTLNEPTNQEAGPQNVIPMGANHPIFSVSLQTATGNFFPAQNGQRPTPAGAPPEINNIRVCCMYNQVGDMEHFEDNDELSRAEQIRKLKTGVYFYAQKVGRIGSTVSVSRGKKYLIISPFLSPIQQLIRRKGKRNPNSDNSTAGQISPSASTIRQRIRKTKIQTPIKPKSNQVDQITEQIASKNEKIVNVSAKEQRKSYASEILTSYPYDVFETRMKQEETMNGRCGIYELKSLKHWEVEDIKNLEIDAGKFIVCLPEKEEPDVNSENQNIPATVDDTYSDTTVTYVKRLCSLSGGGNTKNNHPKIKKTKPVICRCQVLIYRSLMLREMVCTVLEKQIWNIRRLAAKLDNFKTATNAQKRSLYEEEMDWVTTKLAKIVTHKGKEKAQEGTIYMTPTSSFVLPESDTSRRNSALDKDGDSIMEQAPSLIHSDSTTPLLSSEPKNIFGRSFFPRRAKPRLLKSPLSPNFWRNLNKTHDNSVLFMSSEVDSKLDSFNYNYLISELSILTYSMLRQFALYPWTIDVANVTDGSTIFEALSFAQLRQVLFCGPRQNLIFDPSTFWVHNENIVPTKNQYHFTIIPLAKDALTKRIKKLEDDLAKSKTRKNLLNAIMSMAKMLAKSQLTLHENSDLEVASSSTSRTAAPISPQGTTSATRLSGSPDIDPISVALDSVLNSNRAPTTPNRPTTNSISPQSRVTQNLVQNNPDQTLMHNATPGRPTTPVFTTRNPSTAYPPRVNRLMNRLDSLDLANIAAELTSEEENCTKIESMIASFRRGMESFTRLNELSIFLSDRSKKQE